MDVTTTHQGELAIVGLKGKLSVVGADALEREVVKAIDGGAKRLLFVANELDYVSSAGLRVFYVAIKRLDNDASRLAFAGLQPAVFKIFEVVGLSSLVRLFKTETDALTQLAKP